MDSQLATVLTSGSLDVQNGSRCAEGSGTVTEFFLDPKGKGSSSGAGNLQPCPFKAVAIRKDALSINGKKPEVGGTSEPASQKTRKTGGLRQPITVKTGVPVLPGQPIRIKIVVPSQCKRPITNSAISLTKDFACSHFQRPVLVSAGAVGSENNTDSIQTSAVENEGEIKEADQRKAEELAAESFHGMEAEGREEMCKNRGDLDDKIIHAVGTETPFISSVRAVKTQIQEGIKEETAVRELRENIPLFLQDTDLTSCKEFGEVAMVEQTEPLDLSLPKKRETRERRHGRLLGDLSCESSLIMEVDEYEGEGDRDVVEEDDEAEGCCPDATDVPDHSVLSPSFFATSVFDSLSSLDTENLLLIDDQGIPYTLSPDGLKVPQVDASTSECPQSDQDYSAELERQGSPQPATSAGPSLSQSLDNALNAPSGDAHPSPAPAADSPSQSVDQTKAPEVLSSPITSSESSKASQPCVKSVPEPDDALSNPPGISLPSQPIHILANPSTSAPILLLSSSSSSSPQLSSAPVSLSLPLSVTQTPPCASTPMFLLLSSVPSSSGDSASTSTPIAVLDTSTGQLSQITAASTPVSLPLPSGQVTALGSPLPTLSHPVIRLSPSNPSVILSGVNDGTSQDLRNDHTSLLHTQIHTSDTNLGTEAISAEEVSNESNKPSPLTAAAAAAAAASTPHAQAASLTYDPLAQPTCEAEAQSPATEHKLDSEHLPLEDHLYFSSSAAPPSPPIRSILPPGKLEPLDPLDPLSPAVSPNTMGTRRVLYCQLCPRVFFYLSDLERHAITHSQKKPHVCQQCGKAFKRSSHLQRHKHIHTGQRNFVCPICAKRFREAGELQRHQRVHTGEKPYQCQLCHTRFAERNTLRRHTKRKHPYHQVAMEMLNERRDRGEGGCGGGGSVSGVQEEEEDTAEWYSSTVSNLENSESEMET